MNIKAFSRLLLWRLISALAVTGVAVAAMYITGAKITTFSILFIIPGGVLALYGVIAYLSGMGEGKLLNFFEQQRESQQESFKKFINTLRYRKIVSFLTFCMGLVLIGIGLTLLYGAKV